MVSRAFSSPSHNQKAAGTRGPYRACHAASRTWNSGGNSGSPTRFASHPVPTPMAIRAASESWSAGTVTAGPAA